MYVRLHGGDLEGPMFRPLRRNRNNHVTRRAMNPDAIDRLVRKFAAKIGLERGYSAHSMRPTFITTALKNGVSWRMYRKPQATAIPAPPSCIPARLQPREGGEFLRDLLTVSC
jgi:integrase